MNYFTKYIIGLLIIILLFIISYYFFKTKEGFDVNDITKMINDIKDISNAVDDIPDEINNIDNKLTKQFGSVFIQIGNIFEQLLNILQEIADKIIILPSCITTYATKELINTIEFFYNKFVPNIIRRFFGFIYYYTFRYLFEFIGYITGFDDSVKKCYGFDISSEMNKINSSLKNIGSSF
jgi:hypothetical protein